MVNDVTGEFYDEGEQYDGGANDNFVFLDLLDETFHINKRMRWEYLPGGAGGEFPSSLLQKYNLIAMLFAG